LVGAAQLAFQSTELGDAATARRSSCLRQDATRDLRT
jgi:hypothetical protein